jgi:hypothetical protein
VFELLDTVTGRTIDGHANVDSLEYMQLIREKFDRCAGNVILLRLSTDVGSGRFPRLRFRSTLS